MSLSTVSKTAKTQMRVFWYGILIFFLWEFLPEVRAICALSSYVSLIRQINRNHYSISSRSRPLSPSFAG